MSFQVLIGSSPYKLVIKKRNRALTNSTKDMRFQVPGSCVLVFIPTTFSGLPVNIVERTKEGNPQESVGIRTKGHKDGIVSEVAGGFIILTP